MLRNEVSDLFSIIFHFFKGQQSLSVHPIGTVCSPQLLLERRFNLRNSHNINVINTSGFQVRRHVFTLAQCTIVPSL